VVWSVRPSRRPKGVLAAWITAGAVLLAMIVAPPATGALRPATALPSATSVRVVPVPVMSGFAQPVAVTSAGAGLGRLFVVERAGRVRTVVGSSISGTYLDIRSIVNSSGGEQGMLGLAFAPDFSTSRYLFATYTRSDGALVVARFRGTTATDASVSASTRQTVLVVPHPNYRNHNGGSIAFGPDGMLYLGTGDGGSAGDPGNNAQNRRSLLGKILRIDVLCPSALAAGATSLYCVPSGNPYATSTVFRHEIWMWGLRNPWRFSFDRDGTIWIGDVGQDRYEEVDGLPVAYQKGANLGWSCYEARSVYRSSRCSSSYTYRFPQVVLCHPDHVASCPAARSGEAISGGNVYRGSKYPFASGLYVFADYVTGKVWGYRNGVLTPPTAVSGLVGFGRSDSGEIYAVALDGRLMRIGFRQV